MKTLFQNVPVNSVILFNGCKSIKVDEKHVHFVEDINGRKIDYSLAHNQRYNRSTCVCIEGVPVTIISSPDDQTEKKETSKRKEQFAANRRAAHLSVILSARLEKRHGNTAESNKLYAIARALKRTINLSK